MLVQQWKKKKKEQKRKSIYDRLNALLGHLAAIRVAISANEEGEKHRVIQPRIFTLFCSTVHLLT